MMKKNPIIVAVVFLVTLSLKAVLCVPPAHPSSHEFEILTLSTRPEIVSGGDVLVQINVPHNISLNEVKVTLNRIVDVTGVFWEDPAKHTLVGLVTGLQIGKNRLEAKAKAAGTAKLDLQNYPITGPIFSGPHEQPFICTTATFLLPDGSFLGDPIDEDCSVTTRVHYVYRTTGTPATFQPLPAAYPSMIPPDLAQTTTIEGKTVRYIVRVETGTINRAIYQTSILHDPATDPTPSPFTPPPGWNRKLIYHLGGGCQGGWYTQGLMVFQLRPGIPTRLVDPLNDAWLRKGYAVATSTLNIFANNCNDLLSSETTAMVKERFIESYGVPLFTIGTGSSGGSYQSNQTSDNYPGLFDGIITGASFPDITTGLFTLGDVRLLDVYFNQTAPGQFTEEQQEAVSGFFDVGNITFLSRDSVTSALRMDPVGTFWLGGFPAELRYDPVTNPTGARATVYDHTVNVYGRYPDTGFARRPLDNVGVQYGLKALNDGVISVDQFLDLNEKIGGFDIDFKNIPQRTVADLGATRRAYQSGRILNGGGGLPTTPIITQPGYNDPGVGIHLKFWSFSIRERLIKANGHADNQVIVGPGTIRDDLFDQMDRWITAILSDTSDLPKAEKVVKNKPADLVDACFYAGAKIIESQTAFGPGKCNQLYPTCMDPGLVAGAPLDRDIVKCHLKPIDPSDYKVPFSSTQMARLYTIFPQGVCDWSEAGVQQHRLRGTWLSFGPSTDNLIFDVTR